MKKILLALAGNPNSGKTTVFNYYTKSRQSVGNYPGITVEKKEGIVSFGEEKISIIDLPGTYSLTAYSQEELVTRKELLSNEVDVAISVINASALERNLYLVVQLLEMGVPVVIALNMIDESRKHGICIDEDSLSKSIGCPVVSTIARSGEGLDTILSTAVNLVKEKKAIRAPLHISYGADVDSTLEEMQKCIEGNSFLSEYPSRWVAVKYAERDEEISRQGKEYSEEVALRLEGYIDVLTKHLEKTLKAKPENIIADYRYGYIAALLKQGALLGCTPMDQRLDISDKVDAIITHKIFGPIFMLFVIFILYKITFTLGAYPQEWLESFFEILKIGIAKVLPDGMLKSLIVSGIIDGIGSILSFVPLIMLMFIQIAFLEDSGYMARIAYMLDRIFRVFGLHGYSVMPFIISGGIAGGCAIPGIMATRTLRSPLEKLATILTAPYMACGAKIPVFILFVGVFFPEQEAFMMFMLTLLGWVVALLIALLLRKTIIRGPSTPFIMELPPYRKPTVMGIMIHTFERIWQYIKKAGTVILAVAILLWASMTFPLLPEDRESVFTQEIAALEEQSALKSKEEVEREKLELESKLSEEKLKYSVAGRLGVLLEPITQYMGFNWRTNIALLGGIAAKEVTVTTLGIAYSLGEVDPEESSTLAERIKADPIWTKATALGFLLFVLLYAPCLVTLAVIKQETNSYKWMFFSLFFNTIFAYGVAVLTRSTAMFFGY
ncbi:MAG: ferrous iron transport protein B [Desulfovibrionaceae bacterium]